MCICGRGQRRASVDVWRRVRELPAVKMDSDIIEGDISTGANLNVFKNTTLIYPV